MATSHLGVWLRGNLALVVGWFKGAMALVTMLAGGLGSTAHAGEGFAGIGYGTSHSDRGGGQISVGLGQSFETHVSIWDGPQRNRVLAGGVRLPVTRVVSVMLGAAYLERETGNIRQGLNGASELRVHLGQRWACQLSHYSGEGSDASDNLLLCGFLWQRR